jgi:hypothetical protein
MSFNPNYNVGNTYRPSDSRSSPSISQKESIGMAVAVILGPDKVLGIPKKEDANKIFKEYGAESAIGMIFYAVAGVSETIEIGNLDDISIKTYLRARPLHAHIRQFPKLGEFVRIVNPGLSNTYTSQELFYENAIAFWGDVQHNSKFDSNVLDKYVRPLSHNEGDVSVEGRYGNSLRLSQNGLILNNGQYETDSLAHYNEQVKDGSSTIWLIKNNTFDFEVKSYNYLTKQNPEPYKTAPIGKYEGHQVVIDSDRINLISHKEDIILYSRRHLELYSEGMLTINASSMLHINSDLVLLGKGIGTQAPAQAGVRGDDLYDFLSELLVKIGDFSDGLKRAVSAPEGLPIEAIVNSAQALTAELKLLGENKLEKIISDKVFLE